VCVIKVHSSAVVLYQELAAPSTRVNLTRDANSFALVSMVALMLLTITFCNIADQAARVANGSRRFGSMPPVST
jgi:hypothetical protein